MADCTFNCDGGEITFPNFVGCGLVDGFKNVQPRKMWGLNNQSIINDKLIINVSYQTKTAVNMQMFYSWWTNTLNYGHDSFKMTTFIMGHEREINVRIINKLEVGTKSVNVWNFDLEIEVLDNLPTDLYNELRDAICAISGGC